MRRIEEQDQVIKALLEKINEAKPENKQEESNNELIKRLEKIRKR